MGVMALDPTPFQLEILSESNAKVAKNAKHAKHAKVFYLGNEERKGVSGLDERIRDW